MTAIFIYLFRVWFILHYLVVFVVGKQRSRTRKYIGRVRDYKYNMTTKIGVKRL